MFGGGPDVADAVWLGVVQAWGRSAAAEPEPRLVTAVRYRLRLAVAAASQANTDRGVAGRGRTTRPFQQRTGRGGRAPLPQPGCAPRARRIGQCWVVGCARWAWTPPATPLRGRRPARAGAPIVTGPLARHRMDRHHTRGGLGQASITRRDYSEPDRRDWRGREEFAPLGWGNNPSMVMQRGHGRRRAVGAGPVVRAFGETRMCAEDSCTAQLSRYNPARRCAIHQGWDRQRVTRPRHPRPELPGTDG